MAGLDELVAPGAAVERLGTGFRFTEGPIWHPVGGYLLFSDMPGDVRRRWSQTGGVEEARRPSNKCNGMTYDAEGNLIVCEHATSRVVRERPDGTVDVVASHYQGKELQSPNDVVVGGDGSIWFTDPTYGRTGGFGVERPHQLGFQGVYRVPGGRAGEVELVVAEGEFEQPNGLCFSPDASLLYVNDTPRALIKAFPVAPGGTLGAPRLFAEGIGRGISAEGAPDGMKCDERGDIWVTGPGGIWVFAPDGTRIGVLELPEVPANLNWGGPDWRDLYITASTSLYRVRTTVAGNHASYMDLRA